MKQTAIHLSEPFDEVLASLFTLPSALVEIDEVRLRDADDSELRQSARCAAEVKEAFRSLYEAANGRQVESQIGFIAIAPPVAGFLKDKPYYVATQWEFFMEAFARILVAGSPPRENRPDGAWTRGSKTACQPPRNSVPRNHPRRGHGRVLLHTTTTNRNNQH